MDINRLPQFVRNASRLNEVVQVAAKFGIAPWLKDIPADWLQKLLRTSDSSRQISDLTHAERIRFAFLELGTTFIKFGQMLSTRPDLVGEEIANELAKLQSATPADAPETVTRIFEKELGVPPSKFFKEFDATAAASASIGQVHRAQLQDGTRVAVKIQHDGIEDRIKNDLEILVELAKLAEANSRTLRQYRPAATVGEFKASLTRELDFQREQRSLARFKANFDGDQNVHVPATYPEACSKRVLTMEWIEGVGLSKRDELISSGFDLSALARKGADMFLKMVFRDGFYHADPHPGNLLVLPGEVIGILDCGMVGRIDTELREQIEDLLISAIDQDANQLMDGVMRIGQVPADSDREQLKNDLLSFVDDYGSLEIDEFDLGGALRQMTVIIRRHRITLPSRISMLIKMLIMLEGTAQQLSPDFSLIELLQPYRQAALKQRLSPARMKRKLFAASREWGRMMDELPEDVSDIIHRVRHGSFNVHLEHQHLDSIVNRLVLGVLAAALFMGSSSLWSYKVEPLLFGASVPGALGCLVALYLGFLVVRAIKKSGDLKDQR